MSLERKDVVAALTSKGFSRVKDRDHEVFVFTHAGLTRAVWTKVSRGTSHRTLGDPLVGAMSRQLQLSKKDFMALVECSFTAAAYIDHLRTTGLLPPAEPKPAAQERTKKHTQQ